MKRNRDTVVQDMLKLLGTLADDWEYDGVITEDTNLFTDLGLVSLDVVVLAMSVQQNYGQVIPFADLFADMGQRGVQGITVAEWADFVYEHLNETAAGASR